MSREFVIGPQIPIGTTWFDQQSVARLKVHGAACPVIPPTDAAELNSFVLLHYYDLAQSLYTVHARTNDPALLDLARKCADSWWKHPWIGEGRTRLWPDSVTPAPRHAGVGGLILRAIDGRPELWDWINAYTRFHFDHWCLKRVASAQLFYGLREGAFALHYAVWLAKVLPDSFPNAATLRAQYAADVEKVCLSYFGRLQQADGSWRWDDWDTTDADGGTYKGIMQPFMVGLLLSALCDAHQVVTTDAARASIKTQILTACRHLYDGGPYMRIPAVNFNNTPARGFHYFYHGGTTVNPGKFINGSTLSPWLTTERWHVESARQGISTVLPAFGYAYKISGDEYFKRAGEEMWDSAYSGSDGFRAMLVDTAKNCNQHLRRAGSFLAWIGGTVSQPQPEPTPTPAPTPTPQPPTPSPDGTKGLTITDSTGGVWTLDTAGATLRNKIHTGNGFGTMYKWLGGVVYVLGTNGWWYKFTGTTWQSISSQQEPGTQPTVRTATWPKQPGQQNAVLDQQWASRYRLKRVDGNSATFELVN